MRYLDMSLLEAKERGEPKQEQEMGLDGEVKELMMAVSQRPSNFREPFYRKNLTHLLLLL